MAFKTEYCEITNKETTYSPFATLEDLMWCIRHTKEVIINLMVMHEGGIYRDKAFKGYFSKYDDDGFHFHDRDSTTGLDCCIGHDYTGSITIADY